MGNKLGIGGNNLILETCNNYKIYYYYDENNDLIGFKYNNQKYYYIRNAFKTIEKVIDSNGNIVISYRYDPYGKVIMTTKANNAPINHFVYKGYDYDDETKFYYLLNRYYFPELCSWISPVLIDYLDHQSIVGLNFYVYCNNDPVNYYDPTGHSAILIELIIGAVIGAAVGFGATAYIDYLDDGQVFNGSVAWYDYLGATLLGGAIGAGIGAGVGYIAPQIGGALSSFASTSFSLGGGLSLSASGAATMSAGLNITGLKSYKARVYYLESPLWLLLSEKVEVIRLKNSQIIMILHTFIFSEMTLQIKRMALELD